MPEWYHLDMAMILRLSDEEADALRAQAAAEDRSMRDVARAAVREYVDRHTHEAAARDASERMRTRYATCCGDWASDHISDARGPLSWS